MRWLVLVLAIGLSVPTYAQAQHPTTWKAWGQSLKDLGDAWMRIDQAKTQRDYLRAETEAAWAYTEALRAQTQALRVQNIQRIALLDSKILLDDALYMEDYDYKAFAFVVYLRRHAAARYPSWSNDQLMTAVGAYGQSLEARQVVRISISEMLREFERFADTRYTQEVRRPPESIGLLGVTS